MLIKRFYNHLPEILVFSLSVFVLFYALSDTPIARWDELTNIQVVRHSLESGNLLNLQYWGQPFFEKPPLWYLLTGSLVKIFGDSLITFRFVSAFSGLAFVSGIYYLTRKQFGRLAGILATLTLLASGQFFLSDKYILSTHNFRSADLDALQLALMIWALIFFGLSIEKRLVETRFDIFFLLGVILSGLAFLTKGPFGLLPGMVYFAYYLVNRVKVTHHGSTKFTMTRIRFDIVRIWSIGLLFLLVIISPWYLYMFTVHGFPVFAEASTGRQFVEEHFLYHMFGRAGDALEDHDNGPFFYIKVLAQSRFFFSHGILALAIFQMTRSRNKCGMTVRGWWREWKYFSLIFGFIFTFIIISLMQTRLAWYVLYVHLFTFPILGWYLSDLFHRKAKASLIESLIIVNSVAYALITNWFHVGWFLVAFSVLTGMVLFLSVLVLNKRGNL